MNTKIIKILAIFLILVGFTKNINADEMKPSDSHQFNFFSGVFDINTSSKISSELFGVQHSNDDLFRDTSLGKFSPISGFMMTMDSTSYFYTGVQAEYKIGKLNLTPSFTPGLYFMGDGKDLGSPIEFKSELQLSIDLLPGTKLGYSQSHLSNAGLDEKNPGADSYMFNFMKSF